MKKTLYISFIFLLSLICFTYAQESPIIINEIKAEPATVNLGGQFLISCRVSHSQSSKFIRQIAATIYQGERVTEYPGLYDDGTNGDNEPGDGIYSLEIKAGDVACIAQIVFHAIDNDGNEVDSDPISITIK